MNSKISHKPKMEVKNNRMKKSIGVIALVISASAWAEDVPSKTASIQIDASGPGVAVNPSMYGIFYEEINHAGEGGLYAEMVQNRDFEANNIPAGTALAGNNFVKPNGPRTYKKGFSSDPHAWSVVTDGGGEATIQRDTLTPLNEMNPSSLKLVVKKAGERAGVANEGFWGMSLQAGEEYELSFYARTEGNAKLDIAATLESGDGKKKIAAATVGDVGGSWKQYRCSYKVGATEAQGRLVLSIAKPGTVWFDVVSLFPRKTFKNRPNGMRPDLAQMLVDMKPGFLRFPGGCVVEGITLANRIQWKDTIGDIAKRKGNYDLWGYHATYGLGYHEFLQLCEDLGADAMYVVNVGMSCQARDPEVIKTQEALQPYIQDSLDALEYATGPVTSQWGALRAANGHPAPFKIKYVEIGNENRGPDYHVNYRLFYDVIKAKYPDIITIANTPIPKAKVEMIDEHYYVDPAGFFNKEGKYDKTDRGGPKIYVGEYAVNRGVVSGNLLGALAEAVFMLGMERNADVVRICSYAPLFQNVNNREWPVNLILFDSSRVVGRSSYHTQKMFASNRPDAVLKTSVEAGKVPFGKDQISELYALAGFENKSNELIIKAVNPTDVPVVAKISLKGVGKVGNKARVITLSNGDPKAENSLDKPNVVVPVESEFDGTGAEFSYTYKPYSLTVIRVGAEQTLTTMP